MERRLKYYFILFVCTRSLSLSREWNVWNWAVWVRSNKLQAALCAQHVVFTFCMQLATRQAGLSVLLAGAQHVASNMERKTRFFRGSREKAQFPRKISKLIASKFQ